MDFSKDFQTLFLMQQAYATLFSVTNKLQIKGDEYLKDLTSRQFMTIMSILHLPEEQTTLVNIAKKLGTTKQNANKLISSIEQKGFIVTVPSVRDKRSINVKLTESGKQVMLECNEKGILFFTDIFSDFKTEEIETLWDLLKKLYRFDGEEQDGFEDEASGVEVSDDSQTRLLQEFSKRRNRS